MSSNTENLARQKWRMLINSFATKAVTLGGISVIIAITLIFFYLLSVVFPLFESASIKKITEFDVPGKINQQSLFYKIDEQGEVGVRLSKDGTLTSFNTRTGNLIKQSQLTDTPITSFAFAEQSSGLVVLGLENGYALPLKILFEVRYNEQQRIIEPNVEFVSEDESIEVDEDGLPITSIGIQGDSEQITIVSVNNKNKLNITHFIGEESLLDDALVFEQNNYQGDKLDFTPKKILINSDQRLLYLLDEDNVIHFYDFSDKEEPQLIEEETITKDGIKINDLVFAAGGISLLVAQENGEIAQWFPVKNSENKYTLTYVRSFSETQSPINHLASEYSRKGMLSSTKNGEIGIHHLTSQQTLLNEKISNDEISHLAIAPRANFFLAENTAGKISFWSIVNEYPEISNSTLWNKVWYEGYEEPVYLWQSSSASNDFEPKFSLVPISFGTLKAAFYAMLLAVPVAIFGAIFTAYFMSPTLRQSVKPAIEIMEALPTVILGFLAGLWFAPFLETHMPGMFAILLLLPPGVILFAYTWHIMPLKLTQWVPDGWQPILLLPIIILLAWGCIAISPSLEIWFFDGNLPTWLQQNMGIGYDQRNALVVGFAMGFAVIPTIFSIAEDAIFNVPKNLTYGSLALGATTWQTLTRVVILTASPGIFSAVMIGFGRATGETMIVLMATGNTPVMDFNIFEGMRTLSANIAVEMPESEVGSTHYRVLFLAALILFLFTFFFNTIAEIVRHRLRTKYSSM